MYESAYVNKIMRFCTAVTIFRVFYALVAIFEKYHLFKGYFLQSAKKYPLTKG